MSKQEFLAMLRKGLSGLPQSDIEERLTFYSEMIDDRMEEGLTEEEAVSQVGSVNEIVSQILSENPPSKDGTKKIKSRKGLKAWEIIFLVLGSPIWLSLLLAVFAVILSIYVVIWSVIISLWAIWGSFIACSFGGVVAGAIFMSNGNGLTGIAMIGAGIVCAGLSIFLFYGCKAATKGTLSLTKNVLSKRRKHNG